MCVSADAIGPNTFNGTITRGFVDSFLNPATRSSCSFADRHIPSWISISSWIFVFHFVARLPIAHNAPAVRMKICPSDIAGELSV